MAHFAQIDENDIVINVLFVENELCLDENGNESELKGIEYLQSVIQGKYVQTSYNANFRKQYAGIGYFYDKVNDIFIAEKPYESWVLDQNFDWRSPVEYPNDGQRYIWNEQEISWVEASFATPNY